jgi:hypothetical protein
MFGEPVLRWRWPSISASADVLGRSPWLWAIGGLSQILDQALGKAKFPLHPLDDWNQSFPGYLSIHSTKSPNLNLIDAIWVLCAG